MPLFDSPISPRDFNFAFEVEGQYDALLRAIGAHHQAAPSLGGKLLYAGDLLPSGRALLVAGNIAGAASLAATADAATQKQAIREGVADFLVTTLDEALRILKNEIRKREAVAVCVAAAPEAIELEMRERGVAPDLLNSAFHPTGTLEDALSKTLTEERSVERVLVSWSVDSAPAQWLPKLDALGVECFGSRERPEAGALRRWLRLSPRYLGKLAQGFRLVHGACDGAKEFTACVQRAVTHGEIGTTVRVSLNRDEEVFLFEPPDKNSARPER